MFLFIPLNMILFSSLKIFIIDDLKSLSKIYVHSKTLSFGPFLPFHVVHLIFFFNCLFVWLYCTSPNFLKQDILDNII